VEAPLGTYNLEVVFPDGTTIRQPVEIVAGTLRMSCNATFKSCRKR